MEKQKKEGKKTHQEVEYWREKKEGEDGRKRWGWVGLIPSQTTNAHVEIGNPLQKPCALSFSFQF